MTAVISVQKHTITLVAGTAAVSADLSPNIADTSNCIPFVSSRITTVAGLQDDLSAYAVDAYFTAGTPNKVTVATGTSATRAMIVEVTVVEFNSDEIDIQQDTYAMTNTEASDVVTLGPSVDTSTTFLYHTWQLDAVASDIFRRATVGAAITGGGTTATFSRPSGETWAIAGHSYTAEATAGTPYWVVQAITASHTLTDSSYTETLSPALSTAELARSFLIGSYGVSLTGDNVGEGCFDMWIDETTLYMDRELSSGTDFAGEFFVVTFKSGASDSVQRGTLTHTTQDEDDDVTGLTSVAEANSLVHTAGATGSFAVGRFTGITSQLVSHSWCAWSFVGTGDVTAINIKHLLNEASPGSEPYSVSWEVIEWDVGGAPPVTRRAMVIS